MIFEGRGPARRPDPGPERVFRQAKLRVVHESRERTSELAAATTDRRIRTLIVEESGPCRAHLKRALESARDVHVVGETGHPRDLAFEARTASPHVVVVGAPAVDEGCGDAVAKVVAAAGEAKVLIVASEGRVESVQSALLAGVAGYVLHEDEDLELIRAVREVAAGVRYVHATLGAALIAAEAAANRRPSDDTLTPREDEVLQLLVLGHTNREIAELLVISGRTAESHRSHIMHKLGMSTRAELVRHARAQGLLDERL